MLHALCHPNKLYPKRSIFIFIVKIVGSRESFTVLENGYVGVSQTWVFERNTCGFLYSAIVMCHGHVPWYMVYGHSPSGIPDSGYINTYSWIDDGKSFTMAQAHARETGESEDHLPPQKMGGSQEGNCSLRGVLPINFDFDMDIVFATAISGLYNTILMFVAADHGWMGYLSTFITAIIYSCR